MILQKDFDYAKDQQLLYDYHQAFQRVDKIIKRDDGTLPDFWLIMMKDWLFGEFYV
jgi:patched 1 protein